MFYLILSYLICFQHPVLKARGGLVLESPCPAHCWRLENRTDFAPSGHVPVQEQSDALATEESLSVKNALKSSFH